MSFRVNLFHSVLSLLAVVALSGCGESARSQLDEEKEPHFLAGKSRANSLDYQGAIEAFEKALVANPQSSAAHFELACIYDQRESDPAAAIYHYGKYLKLRPGADNAEIVTQHIVSCKQELARTVSLGPITEKQQRDLEKLAEENKSLAETNKLLRAEVESWRAYYAGHPLTAATLGGASPPQVRNAPPPVTPTTSVTNPMPVSRATVSPPAESRTHTVKAGETPSLIARRYGVRVEALMAANPRLDPRRLRVGQALNIPGS